MIFTRLNKAMTTLFLGILCLEEEKGNHQLIQSPFKKDSQKSAKEKLIRKEDRFHHWNYTTLRSIPIPIQNAHLKNCLETNVHESTLVFEKSLATLESIFSIFQKKQDLISSTFPRGQGLPTASTILDKLTEVQKLANFSFKSLASVNHSIDECLK